MNDDQNKNTKLVAAIEKEKRMNSANEKEIEKLRESLRTSEKENIRQK